MNTGALNLQNRPLITLLCSYASLMFLESWSALESNCDPHNYFANGIVVKRRCSQLHSTKILCGQLNCSVNLPTFGLDALAKGMLVAVQYKLRIIVWNSTMYYITILEVSSHYYAYSTRILVLQCLATKLYAYQLMTAKLKLLSSSKIMKFNVSNTVCS